MIPVTFATAKLNPLRFLAGGTPGIGRGNPVARNDAPFAPSRSSRHESRGTVQSSVTAQTPAIDPGNQRMPSCSPAAITIAPLSRSRLTTPVSAGSCSGFCVPETEIDDSAPAA